MNKEMNKDRIKQLHDALIVIKEERKSHGMSCVNCPFYANELNYCALDGISPDEWEINFNSSANLVR